LETREHPLRRPYAWQLALGLIVLGAALIVLFAGDESRRESSPQAAGQPER
jgi:hypothetical protein